MRPTDLLKDEHRVIEQVLDCLELMTRQCAAGQPLDAAAARQAIDFFRNFADACHHAKEEGQLFPLMEQRGFSPDSGPTAVMRMEHEQGRELIAGMERALDGAARGDADASRNWVRNARGYVAMLREHIQKEDHCLFPMADETLSAADQQTLGQRFEQVEREETGAGVHERYQRVADELAERFGVAQGRSGTAQR